MLKKLIVCTNAQVEFVPVAKTVMQILQSIRLR